MNLARAVRTLHRRQWVPRPLETVFDFFERPENLALITPPWLGLRLRTPGPLTMRAGLVIDYHVRVLGWTTRWRSLISDYEPPYGFRDVQVIGPYHRWDHRHRFRREDGGTAIEDLVVYEPPLGPLGGLLDVLVIRRQLAAIFEYRRHRIDALLMPATAPFAGMLPDVLYSHSSARRGPSARRRPHPGRPTGASGSSRYPKR